MQESYDEVDNFDDEYANDNMAEYEAMFHRSVIDIKDAFTHFQASDILLELGDDMLSAIKEALDATMQRL